MRQRSAFRHTGRPAGVDNQRQIFGGIDILRRWFRFGGSHHIIEEKMTGLVCFGFRNFAQESA
jgi:hypothetical protein